jgi:hypothetical protein
MALSGARRRRPTQPWGWRERAALVATLGATLAAAGCLKVEPFACASASACVRSGEAGRCEPTGWCSFPDPACASGWRYGAGAGGGLADGCVDGVEPQRDGGQDAAADAQVDAEILLDAPVDTTPCTEGAASCAGDDLMKCSQGVLELSQTCPLGCIAGGGDARCYTFTPHNVDATTLTAGTVDWVVEANTDVNTAGTNIPPGVGRTTATQTDGARDLVILTVRSLWVKPAAVLRISGTSAVVIVASDHILIEGAIDVSAAGTTAGPGGWRGGNSMSAGQAPAGATAAPPGYSTGTSEDTGGSGGSFGAVGGRGGPAGIAGSPQPGTAFGAATLVPLFGGGGGGGGGTTTTTGGVGGGGGGALQLLAALRIDVTGTITAAGAGGGGGKATFSFGAGAGGGGGGGILLEAPVVVATGVLAANGGGGGGGAYQAAQAGADGTSGQPSAVPAPGGAGGQSSDPANGAGGAGGAGSTTAAVGGTGAGASPNGGGGGGGVGRVALYSRSGAAPGGTCSPPAAAAAITPQ